MQKKKHLKKKLWQRISTPTLPSPKYNERVSYLGEVARLQSRQGQRG